MSEETIPVSVVLTYTITEQDVIANPNAGLVVGTSVVLETEFVGGHPVKGRNG